jgi:hypothetical protein
MLPGFLKGGLPVTGMAKAKGRISLFVFKFHPFVTQ